MTAARLERPLAWATIGVVLALTAVVLERRVSWYLSVDQFGYLTFASDLLHGRVFHDWPPAAALAPALPPRADALSQAYVWDGGRLWSRYAPGFPMLLAGGMALLGADRAPYVNLGLFLLLLTVLAAWQSRLARPAWAPVAVGLAVLVPSSISLWATTVSRDVAAHLFAFAGLFLLLPAPTPGAVGPRRAAAAAALLGFGATIRPDGVLYAVPAVALLVWGRARGPARRPLARTVVAAAIGLVVGLAPSLAYNALATGNPLRATQGMELDHFFAGVAAPRAAHAQPWRGTTHTQVAGSALRLAHLPDVLPQNLRLLWAAHGTPLSLLALAGVAVAALRRSPLAVVALTYGPLALLFYSCWARPDIRYLFGVALLVPLLVVEGALGSLELLGRPAASGRRVRERLVAACVAAAAAGLGALALARGGPAAALSPAPLVAATLAAGALAAAADPARRPARVAAPVLGVALAALAAALVWPSMAFRAPFRAEEMRRARATIAAHLPPGAVVISSEDIGRPAENVGYWTAAHALYLTDLTRWHLSVPAAARLLLDAGMTPYLLLPAGGPDLERILFEELRDFPARLVADVPAARAAEWFVVSHYHRGVPLRVYRIGPPPGARAAG